MNTLRKFLAASFCVALMSVAASAQGTAAPAAGVSANPITDTVRSILERSSKNIIAAADAMPADKYSYKPTPDQITFGHLVVHIINSNYAICGNYSGVKPPTDKPADTDPKDKLMPLVKASFDVCTQALAKATDANLGEQITVFGPKPMARGTALIYLASGMADHYGMQAMYLRLNGILPPTAQKDKM
jgi:uncharacterized damage-inducible protein DinB